MNADNIQELGVPASLTAASGDVRLDAARKRLAESKNQEDALEGIREIVANFLGSEEMGLFRVDRRDATFKVLWSFGIDLKNYDLPQALGDAGLRRVMQGKSHICPAAHDRFSAVNKAQAFVPIHAAGQTIAILAILRLLPQKHGFDVSDMRLLRLLSHAAAEPLFGPSGHSQPANQGSGKRP